jgi:hypothetical protein
MQNKSAILPTDAIHFIPQTQYIPKIPKTLQKEAQKLPMGAKKGYFLLNDLNYPSFEEQKMAIENNSKVSSSTTDQTNKDLFINAPEATVEKALSEYSESDDYIDKAYKHSIEELAQLAVEITTQNHSKLTSKANQSTDDHDQKSEEKNKKLDETEPVKELFESPVLYNSSDLQHLIRGLTLHEYNEKQKVR